MSQQGNSEVTINKRWSKYGEMDVSWPAQFKVLENEDANFRELLAERMRDASMRKELLEKTSKSLFKD